MHIFRLSNSVLRPKLNFQRSTVMCACWIFITLPRLLFLRDHTNTHSCLKVTMESPQSFQMNRLSLKEAVQHQFQNVLIAGNVLKWKFGSILGRPWVVLQGAHSHMCRHTQRQVIIPSSFEFAIKYAVQTYTENSKRIQQHTPLSLCISRWNLYARLWMARHLSY